MRWSMLIAVITFVLFVLATNRPAWAQSCGDESASGYHDCVLGCGSVTAENYYTCLASCNTTPGFAGCVADTGGRPGGLHYHALARGIVEKCNCGQGGMSKKATKQCVAQLTQLLTAMKSVKYFGLFDPSLYSSAIAGIKNAKRVCQLQ
jgi:hypothetical protein